MVYIYIHIHIHTYIYILLECYSVIKNEIGSFAETRMGLVSVIQGEINQEEKNKHHIVMLICGIQENGTDKPICRARIETQRMDMWTWGGGGLGVGVGGSLRGKGYMCTYS